MLKLKICLFAILYCAAVVPAGAQPIVSNLVVNPDFPGSTAGWIEEDHGDLASDWSDQDAEGSAGSGSFFGKARDGVDLGNPHYTHGTVGWQCIDVRPARAYYLAADFKGHKTAHGPFGGLGRVYVDDITGQPCPAGTYLGAHPPESARTIAHSFEVESEDAWTPHDAMFVTEPGESQVMLGLHVYRGEMAIDHFGDDYQTTIRFDNVVLGEARPDMALSMEVPDTDLLPGDEVEIDLELSSQFNGLDSEVRVLHDNRLELVSADCSVGSVVDAAQGGEQFFRWFGIAGGPNPYGENCTITARVAPGFSDVYSLYAQAWCNDCGDDLNPSDNVVVVDLAFEVAPDTAIEQVSVSDFPQPGEDLELTFQAVNNGTKLALSNLTITTSPGLLLHSLDTGPCSNFWQESDYGNVSGAIVLAAGEALSCTLTYTVNLTQSASALSATVATSTTGDYDSTNDSADDATRIVRLLVDRTDDGFDGNPGDGICDQVSGAGGCSIRAAVMEANALAAATGRQFTVSIPAYPLDYLLSRTSGDSGELYGSLLVSRSMNIVGLPDEDGNLPALVADFPEADADRLFRIANPAGFVRIENLNLGGQGLVPTDTDGLGTDGGLLLHQSGVLHLENVALSNGATDGRGGAIYSASDDTNGDLVLEGVRVHDNTAGQGGAVAFVPESGLTTLKLEGSEVFGNQAQTGGGIFAAGVHATALPALSIRQSSLYDNHALGGGGAAWLNNVLLASIGNSTISGNVAEISGGGVGLVQQTALAINNSTIAFNHARPGDPNDGLGGGLYLDSNASATLYNSIVSSNTAQESCSQPQPPLPAICVPKSANCHGSVDSAGYNAMAGDSECGFAPEASDDNTNVQLATLTDNGGPTPTHAPASFNWIVDAGDPACLDRPGGEPLLIDQRGAVRPADGDEDTSAQCDRGAYELSDNARITVSVDDAALGRVQSSPGGIWCGAGTNDTCSALFTLDAEVVLTATVASGSGGEFIGWEGACAGQGAVCTLNAAGDVDATALFVLADQPDFLLGCGGGNDVEVPEGGTAQVNCSVESVNGYSQPVSLLCFESAASIECQLSAASVTPPAGGVQGFTVSIDAGQTPPGDYLLLIEGNDGERVRQAGLGMTVVQPASDGLFSDRFEQ